MFEMNDRKRIAHDPAFRPAPSSFARIGAAVEIFEVRSVHVDIEPIVVVEVAMGIRRESASEMFSCVVHVRRGVVDPERGWTEGRVGRSVEDKVL